MPAKKNNKKGATMGKKKNLEQLAADAAEKVDDIEDAAYKRRLRDECR